MNERKGPDGKPVLTEQQFIDMQADIKEVVKRALEFAEQSPTPDASELYTDVLLNPMKNMSPSGEYTVGEKNPLFDLRDSMNQS
jgi:hypothetical protein